MTTRSEELATVIRDTVHDRREHSTVDELAVEAAALRGYLLTTLDAIDHIRGHVERGEIAQEMLNGELAKLSTQIVNRLANLEDVRIEMRRLRSTNDTC